MPRQRTIFSRQNVLSRTFIAPDDPRLSLIRRDITGGINNRQHPTLIGENMAQSLTNVDLSVPGERSMRPGLTLIEDLGANAITGMGNYDPQGGTDNLLVTEGTNLKRWIGSGSFASVYSSFTSGLATTIIKAFKSGTGDVALVSNGTDNVLQMDSSYATSDLGNTNTSCPKTTVLTSYRNRVWGLKDELLYFSDNSTVTFDRTTSNFRIPCGEERAVLGTRDLGLLVVGKRQIWALNPSVTPVATDKPEKLSEYGCAAGKTFQQVGDDYYYLSFDGIRALRRTELDKLQYGQSYPLSYVLKDEFDEINWAYIDKACAIYWDNKYFIALPTAGSTYNNKVWVYYPATQGWSVITGWNVAAFSRFKVGGEELLYTGEASANGLVYRAWSGYTDNSTAISYAEEGRSEDMGQQLIKKNGGHIKVIAKPTGDYNISVSASFDGGAYQLLGYLNTSSHLITFPTTFPVVFYPDARVFKTFVLDSYGPWYTIAVKLSFSGTVSSSDNITIYETSLTSHAEEYIDEEEA